MRRTLKAAGSVAAVLVLLGAAGAAWLWFMLDSSLPVYDGELTLASLAAPVTIERDALGVATITSSNLLDEAQALGFVHAQERFFQMDLLRRAGAGELSELLGASTVALDEQRRVHQLRETGRRLMRETTPEYRSLLEAYADGVNAGLAALDGPPFEYVLLRTDPEPWVPEDAVLVAGAMYFDLQGDMGRRKRDELIARGVLPAKLADFLYPSTTAWDAPLIGAAGRPASVPSAAVYDLRAFPRELFGRHTEPAPAPVGPGSNNWAVAGSLTRTGHALLANDPHLGLRVPSVWFRTSFERDSRRVTGMSLPGTPSIIFGSNGSLAWGFTNSYGDWLELIVLELDPRDSEKYLTPGGWRTIETVASPIEVADGDPRSFTVRRTVFGPVVGELADGRPYAVRWLAHDPRGYSGGFDALAHADNVREALAIAQRSGVPPQNFVAADADGNIGWTIMGPIPRRVRDGGVSRSGEGSSWDGWLAPDEYPVVFNPPLGRLWTANGRTVDGEELARIGDGGYALGARASQIRDRLLAIDDATTEDMLAIQLDDEARFLTRWRDELLLLLGDVTDPLHRAVSDEVRDWGGHASIDSVGYRLVRGWRLTVIGWMTGALFAEVYAVDPSWTYDDFRDEHWAWALLTEKPAHLLDPRFQSWRSFELAALDELLHELLAVDTPAELVARTWGDFNVVRVRHPLSRGVPLLSNWLDMPTMELPGDTLMPRVQGPGFGASTRFAVSPGDEANGYLNMPGGQSDHPLSPYYGAGHDDWAAGRPTPFLSGPAEHTLTLLPGSASSSVD